MQIFDYLNKEGLLHLIRKIMGRDVDLTQAEYDALPESKNSDGKNYYIYDSDIAVTAEEVGFDGSASGSTAANSQQALDELFAANKKTNESLENINNNLENCFIISPEYSDTVPSGTTNYYEPTLTASIPDGYKLFGRTGLRASLASIYFYSNGRRLTYNQIQIGFKSADTSDLSGVVYSYRFIFIKENMISIH